MPAYNKPLPTPRHRIAILPSFSECVFDAHTLSSHLQSLVPGLEIQSTPTPETKGVIYLPRMTDAKAAVRLEAVLDAFPNLEWVQLPMVGVDDYFKIMRKERGEKSRVWCSGKGTSSVLVAEHALTLLLCLLRHIPLRCAATVWGPKLGSTLTGQTILVLGYGGVAQSFIELVRPFGCRIQVVRRRPTFSVDRIGEKVTFHDTTRIGTLLPRADIVLLALPHTSSTHHLFGADHFDRMKHGAIFLNVARGQVVDTDALVSAVRERRLGGVGIDVVDPEPLPSNHPLWELMRRACEQETATQVILTPHSAVTPQLIAPLVMERIERNVQAFVHGTKLEGVVDCDLGY